MYLVWLVFVVGVIVGWCGFFLGGVLGLVGCVGCGWCWEFGVIDGW